MQNTNSKKRLISNIEDKDKSKDSQNFRDKEYSLQDKKQKNDKIQQALFILEYYTKVIENQKLLNKNKALTRERSNIYFSKRFDQELILLDEFYQKEQCYLGKLESETTSILQIDIDKLENLVTNYFYLENVMEIATCFINTIFVSNNEIKLQIQLNLRNDYSYLYKKFFKVMVSPDWTKDQTNKFNKQILIGGLTDNKPLFVLKYERNRDLLHEGIIGLYCMNEMRKIIPTFTWTYGFTKCTFPYVSRLKKDDKYVILEACTEDLVFEKDKNQYTGLLTEYIGDKSMFDLRDIYFQNDNLLVSHVLIISLSLYLANMKFKFIHYDLHSKNIQMRKLVKVSYLKVTDHGRDIYVYTGDMLPTIFDFDMSAATINNSLRVGPYYPLYQVFTKFTNPMIDIVKLYHTLRIHHPKSYINELIKEIIPENMIKITDNMINKNLYSYIVDEKVYNGITIKDMIRRLVSYGLNNKVNVNGLSYPLVTLNILDIKSLDNIEIIDSSEHRTYSIDSILGDLKDIKLDNLNINEEDEIEDILIKYLYNKGLGYDDDKIDNVWIFYKQIINFYIEVYKVKKYLYGVIDEKRKEEQEGEGEEEEEEELDDLVSEEEYLLDLVEEYEEIIDIWINQLLEEDDFHKEFEKIFEFHYKKWKEEMKDILDKELSEEVSNKVDWNPPISIYGPNNLKISSLRKAMNKINNIFKEINLKS